MGRGGIDVDRKTRILLVTALVAAACLGLYLLARNGIRIPCVFNVATGLRCPGCGNTRAVLALIGGELLTALKCNWLFPAEFFYLAWVYCNTAYRYYKTGKVGYRPPFPWLDRLILAGLVVWGVLRNIIGL